MLAGENLLFTTPGYQLLLNLEEQIVMVEVVTQGEATLSNFGSLETNAGLASDMTFFLAQLGHRISCKNTEFKKIDVEDDKSL